ncbi:MAG: hypothetical protein J6K46_09450 [Sutterella sp.]|nr:hypothetical protein [Sutterella sp.]
MHAAGFLPASEKASAVKRSMIGTHTTGTTLSMIVPIPPDTTYLVSANMTLYKNGRAVLTAKYKAGSGTLTKFGRTEERIDNVVGQLFGEPDTEK